MSDPPADATPEIKSELGGGVNLARCLDCGLSYADFPMDVNLPRGQWLLIHPGEHGLLCAACIVKRASKIPGATVVHAIIEVSPNYESRRTDGDVPNARRDRSLAAVNPLSPSDRGRRSEAPLQWGAGSEPADSHSHPAEPDATARPHLFQRAGFTLHSGQQSEWKIDCDALTDEDWRTLALMLSEVLPRFGSVEGVPAGGLRLAAVLRPYAMLPASGPLLIVDDVLTTGASMEQQRGGRDAIGAVIFARGICPPWVTPLFQHTGKHDQKGSAMAESETRTENQDGAQAAGRSDLREPPMCLAGDPLTDAKCYLRAGHKGPHWGHGPFRTWNYESTSTVKGA